MAASPLVRPTTVRAGPGDEPVAGPTVVLADVTLREHGQNVAARDLGRFGPDLVVRVARALLGAGIRRIEVFSCVSPRVAPAMAPARLRTIAEGIGSRPGVSFVTLVPNQRGFESFLELGLGPEGLGHRLGLFFSAVEEHNRPNLGSGVEESLATCRALALGARDRGVPVVAYLSAAFGFRTPERELLDAPLDRVTELVSDLREMGAETVTLSDLQGVRSPAETGERLGALLGRLGTDAMDWLGYHPHHAIPEEGVALAAAAFDAGIRLFDGSLGAVGGCVTGAPGNAPTEGLLAMLEARGARPGVDAAALAEASECFGLATGPARPP